MGWDRDLNSEAKDWSFRLGFSWVVSVNGEDGDSRLEFELLRTYVRELRDEDWIMMGCLLGFEFD